MCPWGHKVASIINKTSSSSRLMLFPYKNEWDGMGAGVGVYSHSLFHTGVV